MYLIRLASLPDFLSLAISFLAASELPVFSSCINSVDFTMTGAWLSVFLTLSFFRKGTCPSALKAVQTFNPKVIKLHSLQECDVSPFQFLYGACEYARDMIRSYHVLIAVERINLRAWTIIDKKRLCLSSLARRG